MLSSLHCCVWQRNCRWALGPLLCESMIDSSHPVDVFLSLCRQFLTSPGVQNNDGHLELVKRKKKEICHMTLREFITTLDICLRSYGYKSHNCEAVVLLVWRTPVARVPTQSVFPAGVCRHVLDISGNSLTVLRQILCLCAFFLMRFFTCSPRPPSPNPPCPTLTRGSSYITSLLAGSCWNNCASSA